MQIGRIEGLTEMEKQELFTRANALNEAEQLVFISAFKQSVIVKELEFRLGEADERVRKFKELYEGLRI